MCHKQVHVAHKTQANGQIKHHHTLTSARFSSKSDGLRLPGEEGEPFSWSAGGLITLTRTGVVLGIPIRGGSGGGGGGPPITGDGGGGEIPGPEGGEDSSAKGEGDSLTTRGGGGGEGALGEGECGTPTNGGGDGSCCPAKGASTNDE